MLGYLVRPVKKALQLKIVLFRHVLVKIEAFVALVRIIQMLNIANLIRDVIYVVIRAVQGLEHFLSRPGIDSEIYF